jgi:hypothetical protein
VRRLERQVFHRAMCRDENSVFAGAIPHLSLQREAIHSV